MNILIISILSKKTFRNNFCSLYGGHCVIFYKHRVLSMSLCYIKCREPHFPHQMSYACQLTGHVCCPKLLVSKLLS